MTSRYPGGLIRKNAANTAITGASGVWDLGSQAQAVKNNTWPISGLALPVSGSLRFRDAVSPYLIKTPAGAGNRRTWTLSAWVKRCNVSGGTYNDYIFSAKTGVSERDGIVFNTSDCISIFANDTTGGWLVTTQVFRDFSSWYHIVLAVDTTQATASNRMKLYVNGTQITAFSTSTYPTQNYDWAVNNTVVHTIGDDSANVPTGFYHFNGYMAEINFIGGQALTPASFGQISPITGVWEPIKYTGTYGTNGFYFSLSDTSSIGKDFSGNGNNWSPNNFSTANDSTLDLMRDVPVQWTPQGVTDVGGVVRGNYCTLNPLNLPKGGTLSNGNLLWTAPTAEAQAVGTMYVSSGKWYFEVTPTTTSCGIGIASNTTNINSINLEAGAYVYYGSNGNKYNGSSGSAYGATYTNGDIIGIALDLDAGTLVFYKNNTSQGTAFTGLSGTFTALIYDGTSASAPTFTANFGQRPFTYTPPTGFKSLCTTNLPTPTIGATTATAANKYFDATLYTGTGATLSVTNAGGFQPDFVWLKSRSASTNNQLFDAIRGTTKVLVSNSAEAESTSANTITSFNSGGFTVGTNTAINTSSATYVAWQWNAGGSTVTNNSGTISSQVRVNQTAGFSIVTWTGNGTIGATIGHGLGVTPSMIMVKQRVGGTEAWQIYHTSLGATQYLLLTDAAAASNINRWNNTAPTSTVFTVYNDTINNGNNMTYVAYCFAPIAGYSAFGSYTGNGSADGPFVYTGFRPRYILEKGSSSGLLENWHIYDSARNTYNVLDLMSRPNSISAEATFTTLDFVSNGFKIRNSNSAFNTNGATYIYAAFAEFPFKTALAR